MPVVNADLARHPAFPASIDVLRRWGVEVVGSWAELSGAARALLEKQART